ncbi:MAG: hypothetical protein FWB88_12520 [Defluviitaleaceae bacterium]|nr:hypothetical protein [Defluviitaleaceae bacterium]MCL2240380.1 hypothetical protein [Defluviitaleaceae bacterium]
MTYKKILTRFTVVFVACLLFLTFFSQTLADISVPRVVLALAEPGANTIPITGLRQDEHGHFILYVEAVPRRFGSHYYLRLLRVEPGWRSFTHVAITAQWGMNMPETGIVINSDLFVYPGARVRIVGGV